jgi:F-type H+-transporting ATPase subunit c
MNLRKFFGFVMVATLALSNAAFASEGGASAGAYATLASAIAIGLAVLGGTISQSRAAVAALEGLGRNPQAYDKVFTPMILALALIESLVLLAFVVAFVKIPGMIGA